MKSSIIILLISFFTFSCECVNDFVTDKENIPDQNSNVFVVNLSEVNKDLKSYCNDIFIEDLEFKLYKQNSVKYMSGNFVLNLRANEKAILVNSINLVEFESYFAFVYDIKNQTSFKINPILEKNVRIWNLENEDIDFTLFNNEILINETINKNDVQEVEINNFPTNFTLSINSKNINKEISLKNISEIVIINNQILTFEYKWNEIWIR